MGPYSNDKPSEEIGIGLDGVLVDRDAEVPIGVQLAWSLRSRIDAGKFLPGQRLPGLRDLADAAGVNVNTVRAVYQRLEHEGFIDSQQGSGTFVASAPRPPSAAGTIAADAAREARDTGVDPREVAAALYVAQDSTRPPVDEASARRRLLRAEIATLERTLGEMEAAHPGVAPPPAQTRGVRGPALLAAEELEQVRAFLVRRLSSLQIAIDARAEAAADEHEHAPAARSARSRQRARPATKEMPSTPTEPKPAATPTAPKRARRPRSTTRPAQAGT